MEKKSYNIFNQNGLDFLESLPNGSVDLVLTDPPYITSRDSGMDKWADHVNNSTEDCKTAAQWEQYKAANFEGEKWLTHPVQPTARAKELSKLQKNFIKWGSIYGKKYAVRTNYGNWDSDFTMEKLELFVNHFHRVLRDGGTCIIFFDLWKITPLKKQLERAKFKQLRFIEWIKTNPPPINSKINYLTNAREIALTAVKNSKPTFNSKWDKGIYNFPIQGGKERFHPTQKNTKLFKALIEKHSNPGDLVIDPFLGSGTTAVASLELGRRFQGSELDLDYYNKSKTRIANCEQM